MWELGFFGLAVLAVIGAALSMQQDAARVAERNRRYGEKEGEAQQPTTRIYQGAVTHLVGPDGSHYRVYRVGQGKFDAFRLDESLNETGDPQTFEGDLEDVKHMLLGVPMVPAALAGIETLGIRPTGRPQATRKTRYLPAPQPKLPAPAGR